MTIIYENLAFNFDPFKSENASFQSVFICEVLEKNQKREDRIRHFVHRPYSLRLGEVNGKKEEIEKKTYEIDDLSIKLIYITVMYCYMRRGRTVRSIISRFTLIFSSIEGTMASFPQNQMYLE